MLVAMSEMFCGTEVPYSQAVDQYLSALLI